MEAVYSSEMSANFYQATTSKKAVLFIVTATRTSNLRYSINAGFGMKER
jgi:hypothetical protein